MPPFINAAAVFSTYACQGIVRSLRKRRLLPPKHRVKPVQVISFPKSGRTWLRVMLDYIAINFDYTHDSANDLHANTSDFDVAIDTRRYADRKVLVLIRDPRDIVVSSYYHTIHRQENLFDGSLPEFIRHNKYGIEKILLFIEGWLTEQKSLEKCLVVRYEDLTTAPVDTLESIITFAGTTVPRKRICRTVALFSFNNMKYFERINLLKMRYGRRLKTSSKNEANAYKVRKGKAGGYREEMRSEDIDYCTGMIEKYPLVRELYL